MTFHLLLTFLALTARKTNIKFFLLNIRRLTEVQLRPGLDGNIAFNGALGELSGR